MTCQDARAWLSDLLDDALASGRRVEVEAHLAGCAECRFELDRLRATVVALHGLERPRAPMGFVDLVVQRVRPVPWYRRLGAWLFLPLSIKLPAEAAALVVIAGLVMLVWERTPEIRSAAGPESAGPGAPSAPAVEPTQQAPPPTPPAPAPRATSRPSKPSEERPAPAEPPAPTAPGEATVSAPPAAEAKVESEARVESTPRPLAPPRSPAAQADRGETRARAASQAVQRARAPVPAGSDAGGRLIVSDRDAATVFIAALLSTVGGREIGRRQDGADTVVDVQIPQARHDDFIRGLDRIGWLAASARPNVLPLDPPQIRLTIRLEVRP